MKTYLALALLALAGTASAWVQLSEGHIDLGLGYEDGAWDPHIHLHDGDLEYEADEAYLYYGPASRATRPAGSGYDFIGVASGAPIWRNYTSNVANIPWLGFGFEEITAGTFGSYVPTDPRRDPISAEWIELSLVGYTAPTGAHVSFFQGGGASPTLWFATSDGLDATDKFISTAGGHEHGSFAFTHAGIYTLTFQASARDLATGGLVTSDPYTYVFGVEEVVPEPATLAALGLGVAALLRRRRR